MSAPSWVGARWGHARLRRRNGSCHCPRRHERSPCGHLRGRCCPRPREGVSGRTVLSPLGAAAPGSYSGCKMGTLASERIRPERLVVWCSPKALWDIWSLRERGPRAHLGYNVPRLVLLPPCVARNVLSSPWRGVCPKPTDTCARLLQRTPSDFWRVL